MSDHLTETALRLNRHFAAGRERVFQAWIQPHALVRWFCCPGDGYVGKRVDLDCQVGGVWRAEMRNPNDETLVQIGTCVEITAPERLVFTYGWEDGEMAEALGETLVSVVFHDQGDSSEVVLTQIGFPDEGLRDEHAWGWDGCFDALERLLTSKSGPV